MALGVIAASAGSPTVGLPVCLVFAFVPWLITFNATRSVMRASERGLAIGDFADQRMIPWDQVDRVALKKNEHFRVVVHAYAGSVIIDQGIESKSAEKRFTDFTRSIDQLQQMAGPSAAEASVNRGTMRAELHRGTGVQLDGAGTSATSYWAPDPTGAHDLRLISMGQWTPMVVTAGVPGSDLALSGSASFEWIGPATAPTRTLASEWFGPGIYVFRAKWKKRIPVSVPVWYSAVWKDNRPIYLIEDKGRRFTAVDSGTSFPAARRSRTSVRSHFSDNGISIHARSNGAVIDPTTGTSIASTYAVANQRPKTDTGDHTVVITVPNAIPTPLGLLILSYATRKRPFFLQPS